MRVVGFGGRDYKFTFADYMLLSTLNRSFGFTEAACGMCNYKEYQRTGVVRGADMHFYAWCIASSIPVVQFPAEWDKYPGKSAAYIRNQAMAQWAGPTGAAIGFPGGAGTSMMMRLAKLHNLKILYDGTKVHG